MTKEQTTKLIKKARKLLGEKDEKVRALTLEAQEKCKASIMELIASRLEFDREDILECMRENDSRKAQLIEWLLFDILCSPSVNHLNEKVWEPIGQGIKSKDYVAGCLMKTEDKIFMMECLILKLARGEVMDLMGLHKTMN